MPSLGTKSALAMALAIKFALVVQLTASLMSLPDGIQHILGFVPTSSFQCERDGYFGDIENECRIFHLCQKSVSSTGRLEWRHWTYACGNQTMFNQLTLTCAFVDEAIPCKHAGQFQYLNEVIHRPREPFLTDADVTSGFSYYTNRVMSDGARARAFQDSHLMAQIGGHQHQQPEQADSLAPVASVESQFDQSDNRLQELPVGVDGLLALSRPFQDAFGQSQSQSQQQVSGQGALSSPAGAHQGEQSQLSPQFALGSDQVWFSNRQQQLPAAPVAATSRAEHQRVAPKTGQQQPATATDSSGANSFTFTYATDHSFGGRSDASPAQQQVQLPSWSHAAGQFAAPPAPAAPTTTTTAAAAPTPTTTTPTTTTTTTTLATTTLLPQTTSLGPAAAAASAFATTTLASQVAAGDRLAARSAAARHQQVQSTTFAARVPLATTLASASSSTLAAATTTAASTTTTANKPASTTTAVANSDNNKPIDASQQQPVTAATTTISPQPTTVRWTGGGRSNGQARRRQASLRSSGFESSRLTRKAAVVAQAGELAAGQLQKRQANLPANDDNQSSALVMRNQVQHLNRVKRLNRRNAKLEAAAGATSGPAKSVLPTIEFANSNRRQV